MARANRLTSIEDYFVRSFVARRVFEALCAHPYGLTVNELIAIAYHGASEPDWARSSLQVCICLFNRKAIKNRWGLRIHGTGGPSSKYLIWLVRDKS